MANISNWYHIGSILSPRILYWSLRFGHRRLRLAHRILHGPADRAGRGRLDGRRQLLHRHQRFVLTHAHAGMRPIIAGSALVDTDHLKRDLLAVAPPYRLLTGLENCVARRRTHFRTELVEGG